MKKYRLKQWYPSLSEEINEGDIFTKPLKGGYYTCKGSCVVDWQVEKFPEYWEEVIEKNWEIIEIKRTIPRPSFNVFTRKREWFYADKAIYSSIGITEEEMLNKGYCVNSGDFYISKVGRLSDDKVFSVGDKVSVPNSGNYKNPQTIISFEINKSNNLIVHTDSSPSNGFNLSKVEKVEPFYITEDGVAIEEDQKCAWVINGEFAYMLGVVDLHVKGCLRDFPETYKVFSTKSAAEEYLLYNTPCLSLNDIKTHLKQITIDPSVVAFVKSKIES